jgi:2',3'-cyclic-nucleotide 2'-phosphodiesterase (5'-nucleotidase family)
VLDAGDAWVGGELAVLGDFTQGEAIVAGMNMMGYDAMALGPKELSLGPDVLRERMAEATFAVLSANVVLESSGEPVADPYTVLDVAGHRVGIVGLTRMPEAPQPGFQVLDQQQATAQTVAEVADQADTVILLTNTGYRSALEIAGAVPGIDLVVAGLPDQLPRAAVRAPGTGTIAVTAEQPVLAHTGRRVGKLAVTLGSDGSLSGESWESVQMDGQLADDPVMAALLDGYRK